MYGREISAGLPYKLMGGGDRREDWGGVSSQLCENRDEPFRCLSPLARMEKEKRLSCGMR